MNSKEMTDIINKLEIEKSKTILNKNGTQIYLIRPSKTYKSYDPKKNFQIFLKEDNREFRPNHLRVMIDLNLRIRARPDLKNKLLIAFDNIFLGKDPLLEVKPFSKEKFEHYLNDIEVIAQLSQLFILEQELNYDKPSKFDPPTMFYQGWIRQFIDNTKEIDNLCMSVCNRQPPQAKYTHQNNKKHKKYNKDAKELWYLD
ncbi:MAG: hypothetical protein PHU32_04985 [Candidatus ainarchaeum sp.]|nr:hypothetical protein [Candidatus ainarchaeum sp.]